MTQAGKLRFCAPLSYWCLLFTLDSAQVTASVSGTVEDASGAALSGVTVTVKSVETGFSRVTTTAENGGFRVLSLPLGPVGYNG